MADPLLAQAESISGILMKLEGPDGALNSRSLTDRKLRPLPHNPTTPMNQYPGGPHNGVHFVRNKWGSAILDLLQTLTNSRIVPESAPS